MKDFNQKIGFEFGKHKKDFSKIQYNRKSRKLKKLKEESLSRIIKKLRETGKFEEIYGTIGSGKEASILVAKLKKEVVHKEMMWDFPQKESWDRLVCIKAYRYFTGTIQKRLLGTKHVFADDMAETTAKQEFRNLHILYEAGIPVPKPINRHENYLIMELIRHPNTQDNPAPLLADIKIDTRIEKKESDRIFELIMKKAVDILACMFLDAHMVHGDYSIHNILFASTGLSTMDVSQSVQYNINTNTNTPVRIKINRAFEIFSQDLENLNRGFKRIFRRELDMKTIKKEVEQKLSPKLRDFLQEETMLSYDKHYVPDRRKLEQVQKYHKYMEKERERFKHKNSKRRND